MKKSNKINLLPYVSVTCGSLFNLFLMEDKTGDYAVHGKSSSRVGRKVAMSISNPQIHVLQHCKHHCSDVVVCVLQGENG